MAQLADFFSKEDLLVIKSACSDAEQTTSGEIRVSIFMKRDAEAQGHSLKEFALHEFYHLKMDETRDKTGILILIILEERQFYILADQGINEKVGQAVWDQMAAKMSQAFRRGEYTSGLLDLIHDVGNKLTYFFPIKQDDRNELSDGVVIHE